jgi:hypothetical protein
MPSAPIATEEFKHGLVFRDRLVASDDHAGAAPPQRPPG